jgi:MoaA/NifB/PqqE/SkfB family radical SAM enzyme
VPNTCAESIIIMNQIVKVEPTENLFSLTWMLGSRCNYDCMYCPSELHDSTSKFHDLDTLKEAWRNIYAESSYLELNYKISFTGGEVTANKNFLPLVNWLRENYSDIERIDITTNGSASINYYKKLSSVVESISFSTHSEFFNEAEFFKKVSVINQLMIRPKKSLHVNVMNEYWNQHRILLYKAWLTDNNISYSINDIDYSMQVRTVVFQKGTQNFEQI